MNNQRQKITAVLYALLIITSLSCSKSSDSNANDANDFMEITIGGKAYNQIIYTGGTGGFVNQTGCVAKPHFQAFMSQFDLSGFFFDSNIMVLQNETDFKSSNTGTYKIVNYYLFPKPIACNLDLLLGFKDKSQSDQSTTLLANGINTISNISIKESNSTNVLYQIKGNFTCNFKNKANAQILITGKYQITIPFNK